MDWLATRRQLLGAAVVGVGTAIAGCSSGDETAPDSTAGETASATPAEGTETATATPFGGSGPAGTPSDTGSPGTPYGDDILQFVPGLRAPRYWRNRYEGLRKRLASETGVDSVKPVFNDVAANLADGTADAGEVASHTVAAGIRSETATPAVRFRFGDRGWAGRPVVITYGSSSVESLPDLEGRTVVLGRPASVHSSLAQLDAMRTAGLSIPDRLGERAGAEFTPKWRVNPSDAVRRVSRGEVAAAAIPRSAAVGSGTEYPDPLREVHRSPPLPWGGVVVSAARTATERAAIRRAYTGADESLFRPLPYSAVMTADRSSYRGVVDLIARLPYDVIA